MVKDQYPAAFKEATESALPQWLDAFRALLEIDPLRDVQDASDWSPLAIRIQIFKVRDTHMLFVCVLNCTTL